MPSRSPKAAVDAAVERLRRVAACVTDRPVIATGYRPSPRPHYFGFAPPGEPAPLRTRHGPRGVRLSMELEYLIERGEGERGLYRVRTTAYEYTLHDREDREILAYHWHPTGISPVRIPHLHLSGRLPPLEIGRGTAPAALGEMHLPTGPVTFADVVWLLITEFAIAPRRTDWETILEVERAQISANG